jgi:phosphonate transport system permease protein
MIAWPTRTGRPSPIFLLAAGMGVLFMGLGFAVVGLTPSHLVETLPKIVSLERQVLVTPDGPALPGLAFKLVETMAMAFVASFFAILISVPCAFLASRRTSPFLPLGGLLKAMLSIVRTVPDLVWAIAFVSAFGLGPVPGVAALTVTTSAFLVKFHYESLEVAPMEPEYGVAAHGARWLACRLYGVVPSALPDWVSQWVYSVDSNLRSATVLGFVGAGGIGFDLSESIRLQQYNRMAPIIFGIFILVSGLDAISDYLRRRMHS